MLVWLIEKDRHYMKLFSTSEATDVYMTADPSSASWFGSKEEAKDQLRIHGVEGDYTFLQMDFPKSTVIYHG